MDEEPLHEQIARYDRLSTALRETTRERASTATAIGSQLSEAVTDAVSQAGVNVTAVDHTKDGHSYRLEARLDKAALVAAVSEQLPGGFVVSHVNDDGSLSIEWTGERETPSKREHGAILKAIIAEEMVLDEDGLVESVPPRKRVLARAVELGVDEDDALARLDRLVTLNVVDIEDGYVYPDENFSRL